MPRRSRAATGGLVFHVVNRRSERLALFGSPREYSAFERVLADGVDRTSMRLLSYCLMPNHWHLMLWPRQDDDMAAFLKWTSGTHAQRWRLLRGTTGEGAVYQGRYRATPVQTDRHFVAACRYIERNPVRAGLVARAEDWQWSSASPGTLLGERGCLHDWPVERPRDWLSWVNEPEPQSALSVVRRAVQHGVPLGDVGWAAATAERLGWHRTGARGRPAGSGGRVRQDNRLSRE